MDSALIERRRDLVYLVLTAFFVSAMTMLNIIGLMRFVELGPFTLAIGVLPYPITFLITDIVSELYGRSKANFVVTLGLLCNIFVLGIVWLSHAMPEASPGHLPPWQVLHLGREILLPNGRPVSGDIELFELVYLCTSSAVGASMLAYIAAQFLDIQLFHFWKRLTKGRHLWLRNNGSTVLSQLVDSVVVIAVTFGPSIVRGDISHDAGLTLLWSNYSFKLFSALVDTIPLYIAIHYLRKYLHIPLKVDE